MLPVAILLDRDGVLNQDLKNSVLRLADLRMIPGSAAAVATLCRAGMVVAVCSNQACVGRGELSLDGLHAINTHIEAAVAAAGGVISSWHVCTHRAEEDCACRKPSPGLLLAATAALGCRPEQAVFVGDDSRDVAAARAAGCSPWLVLTGKGNAAHAAHPDVPYSADLCAFAQRLTEPAKPTS